MADKTISVEDLLEYEHVVTRTFKSEEEGIRFYNSYAREKGFSVRKSYAETRNDAKEVRLRVLVCSRQGFRELKYVKRKERIRGARNISRLGCRAKLVIELKRDTGEWYVKDFVDDHNHQLCPPDQTYFLRSHRVISDVQKEEILEMEIAGIRKHQIMKIMRKQYGGYQNTNFIEVDLYNFCYRHKMETIDAGDAETVLSHLKARQARDPDFFFRYEVDENRHLKRLFWSDSQSRLDYEAFGDVVVFDSTYRTNRYRLPFVPFVGLNHHRSTVVFGCGIISDETVKSYEWLLKNFVTAMSQKHPLSVITDGDLAMQSAIRSILPQSHHKLCTWHIEQNVVKHFHDSDVAKEFRKFIYDICSTHEFESKWATFRERNNICSDHLWFSMMFDMRHLWAAAYQVGKCFLGLRSNQRSESLNSTLHSHLDRKMTLFDMLQHYEECLSNMRIKEAKLDHVASQSEPFCEPNVEDFKRDAAVVYTPTIYKLIKEQIDQARNFVIAEILDGFESTTYLIRCKERRDRKFEVDCVITGNSLDIASCSCLKLQCTGIPCGHIFCILKVLRVMKIPKCLILYWWTIECKVSISVNKK